jgi:hypothetical protein
MIHIFNDTAQNKLQTLPSLLTETASSLPLALFSFPTRCTSHDQILQKKNPK